MIITVIAATTNKITNPFSVSFTDESLQLLADSSVGVPITVDYDYDQIVGKVLSAKVTDEGLEIKADIHIYSSGMYLSPGFTLPGYKAITYGIISNPDDKTLPAI